MQYMPKKPTKWGIKTWTVADASNGYIWNLSVYTGWHVTCYISHHVWPFIGKDRNSDPEKGLAHNVVVNLVSGLEGKGYHIYTDNFYSSPDLFIELKMKGFEACSTVRINRLGIPKEFQQASVPIGTQDKTKFTCLLLYRRNIDNNN